MSKIVRVTRNLQPAITVIDCSTSSSIAKMVYQKSTKTLSVQWKKSASAYQYTPVTVAQVKELVNADSKGKWLVENITTSDKYNPQACAS